MFTSERSAAAAEVAASLNLCKQAGPVESHLVEGRRSTVGGEQRAARESYEHYHGHVFTSVRPIAQRCAGQPVRVARLLAPGKRPPSSKAVSDETWERSSWLRSAALDDPGRIAVLDQHPLLDVLSKPNRVGNEFALKYVTIVSLEMTGWAFWWITRDEKGRLSIWHMPTHLVEPKHEGRIFSGWKIFQPSGGMQGKDVPAEEIAPFWYPSPTDPVGAVSPLSANRRAVLIDEYIQEAQQRAFQQGINPGMAVIVGEQTGKGGVKSRPRLTRRQRNSIRGAVLNRMRGLAHWYEPLIFDRVVSDVKKISNIPSEMDFAGSTAISQSRVGQGFGVGKAQTGAVDGMTYGALGAADALFVDNTVNPKLDLLGRCITGFVLPAFDKTPGVFVFIEPARSNDSVQRFNEFRAGVAGGLVTREEFRSKVLHIAPKPTDGETLMMPMGVQEVVVGQPPPAAPPPTTQLGQPAPTELPAQVGAQNGQPKPEGKEDSADQALPFRGKQAGWQALAGTEPLVGSARVFDEAEHPRDEGGRFSSGGGSASAEAADVARGRPTIPSERIDHEPPKQKMVAPPQPSGKPGRAAGGFTATGQTNTELGDMAEKVAEQYGLRRIIPEGERRNPLDLEWDHSGMAFELKAVTTASTEYKVRMKAKEAASKRAYAKRNKLKAGVMIMVMDTKARRAYTYWRNGIGQYRLSKGNLSEWNYMGSVKYSGKAKKAFCPTGEGI